MVKLFDLNCENEKNKTGTSVVLIETDGPNLGQGDSFSYHLGLDQTKIGGNAGGLVTFTGVGSEGKSKGRIKFCTRVSSYESNIEVSFRESNFDIGFDLTNNIFSLGNVSIQENSPDTFQSNVQSSFQVAACQCKLDFSCYSTGTNPTIQQDDSLTICLQPTGPNAEVVHISNFNIIMSAGSYTYSPVGLGPGSWNSDALTLVSTNGSDDIVKIVTPVVAQFFIQGHDSLDVTGNAFLEYDSSKGETGQGPVYAGFRLSINMFVNNGTGCFQSLFKTIKGAFKRVKD